MGGKGKSCVGILKIVILKYGISLFRFLGRVSFSLMRKGVDGKENLRVIRVRSEFVFGEIFICFLKGERGEFFS